MRESVRRVHNGSDQAPGGGPPRPGGGPPLAIIGGGPPRPVKAPGGGPPIAGIPGGGPRQPPGGGGGIPRPIPPIGVPPIGGPPPPGGRGGSLISLPDTYDWALEPPPPLPLEDRPDLDLELRLLLELSRDLLDWGNDDDRDHCADDTANCILAQTPRLSSGLDVAGVVGGIGGTEREGDKDGRAGIGDGLSTKGFITFIDRSSWCKGWSQHGHVV
ncbi:uncharacterized protein BCR38DRAFT_488894 [Pseudomassariella vexata]|uniref:Uncharacterized protein n=1 Tax=Pseudomassariella vexata TaxID=1141098 RepID=A0A1Y2DIV5_9PEZI|nr:uncharacterized protein BCR38DRAFT_488894 [Pseudomassariella vexata]ORY59159.1 hypothetical protein BCR38DRAFT_488894 [Pseudomassariella vexata]